MKKLFLTLLIPAVISITSCGSGTIDGGTTGDSNPPVTEDSIHQVESTTMSVVPDSLSTDPSVNPDSIKASMKMSLQMRDTTNKL